MNSERNRRRRRKRRRELNALVDGRESRQSASDSESATGEHGIPNTKCTEKNVQTDEKSSKQNSSSARRGSCCPQHVILLGMTLVTFCVALSGGLLYVNFVARRELNFLRENMEKGIEVHPEDSILFNRNPELAKALHNRVKTDLYEYGRSHEDWYYVNLSKIPDDLRMKFVQFYEDKDTTAYLKECYERSSSALLHFFRMLIRFLLTPFFERTSINGLLKESIFFVFSKYQIRELLQISKDWKAANLLDLGAGDGAVTAIMAPHFGTVYATEAAFSLVWRLKFRGYTTLGINTWHKTGIKYDVISCLNLLDRCERPLTMLRQMKDSLVPGTGRIVLALVLPFKAYVEFGGKRNRPFEQMNITGGSLEEQMISFVRNVLEPAGLVVERFTRLPYLNEGNLNQSFYLLFDFVFILKPAQH